jgi:hypothetical protein
MTRSGHQGEMQQGQPPFEIRECTFLFAVRVVKLVKRFPRTLDATEIGRCHLIFDI